MQWQEVAVVAPALANGIPAGDAEVDAAIAHAHGDVARALKQHGQAGQRRERRLELAWVWLVDAQAGVGQEVDRVVGQSAFAGQGQSNIDTLSGHRLLQFSPQTPTLAPR